MGMFSFVVVPVRERIYRPARGSGDEGSEDRGGKD